MSATALSRRSSGPVTSFDCPAEPLRPGFRSIRSEMFIEPRSMKDQAAPFRSAMSNVDHYAFKGAELLGQRFYKHCAPNGATHRVKASV